MVVFCSLQCIRHDASPKEEAAPDGWLGVAGGREGPSHRAPQLAPWATRALAGARVINSTELQRFPKGDQSAQARIDSGVSGTFARRVPWKFRARSSNDTARYCRTWATVSEPWRSHQRLGCVLKLE